jgi:hypothetical protein
MGPRTANSLVGADLSMGLSPQRTVLLHRQHFVPKPPLDYVPLGAFQFAEIGMVTVLSALKIGQLTSALRGVRYMDINVSPIVCLTVYIPILTVTVSDGAWPGAVVESAALVRACDNSVPSFE